MAKLKRRAKFIPGARPGSVLNVVGSAPPKISVTCFGVDTEVEMELESPSEIVPLLSKWTVVWVEIQGLGDKEKLTQIAKVAEINDLTLEDVANQNQRPKMEDQEALTYITTSGPRISDGVFEAKQLDLFLRNNLLVSFVETDYGWFIPVKKRIRQKGSRIRRFGVHYLLYALLDTVVDYYFPVLQDTSEILYELENKAVDSNSYEIQSGVNRQRRNLFEMQRVLRPTLDVVQLLLKRETLNFVDDLDIFFRDLKDHLAMGLDAIEARREHARTIIDMSMSPSNHRMSETMKVLTIIATIFIPLSFIAGLFGMNFDRTASPYNMPELGWKYGYLGALGLMLLIGTGLAFYFYKKKWIGKR